MEGLEELQKAVEAESQEPTDLVVAKLQEKIRVLEEEKAMKEEAYDLLLDTLNQVSAEAYVDAVTNLRTHRFFDTEMDYRTANILRNPGSSLSLIFFDLDDFGSINKRFGYSAANEALAAVAKIITKYTREEDMAARWGGDELALTISGIPTETLADKAESIRAEVEELRFEDYPDLRLTLSIGIASSPDVKTEENSTVPLLKKALFDAASNSSKLSKANGKNRVTVYNNQ
jgi:diguanylate cyclase (GGDEF)-like protein